MLELVRTLDGLYQAVAADPAAWEDEALSSWAAEMFESLSEGSLRPAVKQMRAGIRQARRLRRYLELHPKTARVGWESAVDEALGSKGWKPTLDIARLGLEIDPSPELFEEVRRRYRMVHFQPWPESRSYEEWLEGR